MSWSTWAAGTLQGISAPVGAVNLDTLWAWSGAESLPRDRMSWNNPLNTTQPEGPGNVDANSVGVKIYPTEGQGVRATVITLLNGRYPLIVDHLRRSVPRQSWSDCCGQLATWGTGCAWIARNFGAVPGVITGGLEMLDPNDPVVAELLFRLKAVQQSAGNGTFVNPQGLDQVTTFRAVLEQRFTNLDTAVAAVKTPAPDTQAILSAIADLKAHPAVVADPTLAAAVAALGKHLGIGSP